MELEERKILTQAVRKKKKGKEEEKETKLHEQFRIDAEKHTVEKITIPLIVSKAQKDKLNLKSFDARRPEIQKMEEEKIKPVNLPSIKLSLKNLKTKKANTNLSDKSKSIQIVSLSPTKLTVKALNTERCAFTNSKSINTVELPKLQTSDLKLKPIGQNKQRVIKFEISTQKELTKKLESKPVDIRIVQTIETTEEEESKEYEEITDFIELLLGKGSSKILSGKPLCIIVERHPDKYEYIVATICREVYREKRGGYLQPIIVKTVEDVEFEFKADVSDQIIIIENAKYSESLRKVIMKLPFSSLGFLILVTDNPEELDMMIRKNIPEAEEYILKVEPVKIDKKLKINIVEFISGSQLLKSYSFGEDFMKATQKFNDQLERFLDFNKAPKELKVMWHRLMTKSPDSSEQASEEHSAMKSFVWQYLWKKYKKAPKLEDEMGVDVSIDGKNYEIETFYGCGDPKAKLTEKMEKKFTRNDDVFFVLRNISILIHLRDLITFKRTWKSLKYNVDILGIDFNSGELIPIEKFIKGVVKWRK